MKNDYAVEFKGVYKKYRLKNKKSTNVDKCDSFYALNDISFKVEKGDAVGILGTNGSGKSTLSLILAGISTVDKGTVRINGEQALIAINTGLKNQLTGLENIKAKGALLGLSKKRIEEITAGVIEFAELGDFLYEPVKNYSSGMKARLGFSISIYLNPDIIIIDEALSVGDSAFAAKCIEKTNEFKKLGKTIFFISHSLQQVKYFCNKGLWIEGGVLKEYGEIETVANNYSKFVEEYKRKTDEEKKAHRDEIFNNRLVINKKNSLIKLDKKDLINNINKKKITLIMLTTILIAISIFGIKYKNRDKTEKVLDKDYSYVFMLEGNTVDAYKDANRSYMDELEGETLGSIINVDIEKNGNVNISKIPNQLQYYYEKINKSDELRFINLINGDRHELVNELSKLFKKELDNVFIINQEDMINALKQINIITVIKDDNINFISDSNSYKLNLEAYKNENSQDLINLNKEILSKLIVLDDENKEMFLKNILNNNSDENINQFSNLINVFSRKFKNVELTINYIDFKVKEKLVKNFIINNNTEIINGKEILDKTLLYIDEGEIQNNIYVQYLLENNIEEVLHSEEEYQETIIEAEIPIQEVIEPDRPNQEVIEPEKPNQEEVIEPEKPNQEEVIEPEKPNQEEVTEPEKPNQEEVTEPEKPNQEEVTEPEKPNQEEVIDPEKPNEEIIETDKPSTQISIPENQEQEKPSPEESE